MLTISFYKSRARRSVCSVDFIAELRYLLEYSISFAVTSYVIRGKIRRGCLEAVLKASNLRGIWVEEVARKAEVNS